MFPLPDLVGQTKTLETGGPASYLVLCYIGHYKQQLAACIILRSPLGASAAHEAEASFVFHECNGRHQI